MNSDIQNQLSLYAELHVTHAVITGAEFGELKETAEFREAVSGANLYLIAKRPPMYFSKVVTDDRHSFNIEVIRPFDGFTFELRLRFQIPVHIELTLFPKSDADLGHYDKLVIQSEVHTEHFSPEGLLFASRQATLGLNDALIFSNEIKYEVLYAGKATGQSVVDRLESHGTLMDILLSALPDYAATPTRELVLILISVTNTSTAAFFPAGGGRDPQKTMGELLEDKMLAATLDAEKALIVALRPPKNKIIYKQYPRSKDGLYSYNIDTWSFQILDIITFITPHGEVRGFSEPLLADTLFVDRLGKGVKIFPPGESPPFLKL